MVTYKVYDPSWILTSRGVESALPKFELSLVNKTLL